MENKIVTIEEMLNSIDGVFSDMEKYGVFDIFIENDIILVCLCDNTWRCFFTNCKDIQSEFLSIKFKLKEKRESK